LDPATVVGVLLALALLGLGRLMQLQHLKRRIARVDRLALADASEGQKLRFAGAVRAIEPVITAPISGRSCVLCELRIETRDEDWWPLEIVRTGVAFGIEDGTGHAVVDPANAELALTPSVTSHEVREADLTAEERRVLADLGLFGDGNPAKRRKLRENLIRFRESVVLVGARIAVVGAGMSEADDIASGYRETATRLRFAASAQSPLLITDDAKLAT
jgi:hypothetical protein